MLFGMEGFVWGKEGFLLWIDGKYLVIDLYMTYKYFFGFCYLEGKWIRFVLFDIDFCKLYFSYFYLESLM